MGTVVNTLCVAYLKVAETADLKSPQHKKNCNCAVMGVSKTYGDRFGADTNTEPSRATPETNTTSYLNYISIKKGFQPNSFFPSSAPLLAQVLNFWWLFTDS